MRFGSVCSGIEAASVAFKPLGWTAAWFSEIEPFPSGVLAHHFPSVPNLGDMSDLPEKIRSGAVEAPDMLCGGTPCQAFSVAGRRRSLDDARGNLSLTFCEVADAIDCVRGERGLDAAVVFWENVPGVLSTKDNAFGCLLGELVGADAPLSPGAGRWPSAGVVAGPKRKAAWRVLDAQHFGVPQRRRRVFVVASARAGFDPAKVLFERARVRGDSASSGGPREDAAGFTLGSFAQYCRRVGTLTACDAEKQFTNNQSVDRGMLVVEPAAYDMTHACDVIRESREAPTLQARMGTGGNQIPLVLDTPKLYNTALAYGTVTEGTVCKTLTAQIDNQTDCPLVLQENGNSRAIGVGVSPPLKTTTVSCFATGGVVGTLTARDAEKQFASNQAVDSGMRVTLPQAGVRRITPVECERLQGFPDNWTRIPCRGKDEEKCPDAPRYKAIGNSWAVPCVRWIGERLKIELEQNER